jgi:hypothetical protein
MMKLDVIGSAFAISIYLLVYFATIFGYSPAGANATWYWVSNAIALVAVLAALVVRVRRAAGGVPAVHLRDDRALEP